MSDDATLDEFASTGKNESDEIGRSELIQGVAWSVINSVPEEWAVNNIESNIDILSGNNFSSEYFVEKEGIPLIRIRDLAEGETTVNFDGEYDSRYLINQNDLLVGMDGEFEPHLWAGRQALLNQRVCKIEPKSGYNRIFFRYAIEKPLFYIQKSIAGTTVKHLSQSNINDLNLPTPPLAEQRKIATVLHTVDQAIQKTEEIIETLNRVEIAARKSLLTRGVGSNERSQSTPTGEYPADWEIVRAGNEVKLRNGEFLPKSERDEDGEYPVYGGNGIMGRTHDSTVEPETVIIGRVGAYCGNVHITAEEAWVTDNAIVLTDVSSDYIPRFLTALLSKIGLGQFSEQSAQPRISQSTVENLRIPKPPISEQETIVEILSSIEQNKNCNQKYQNRMEYIKQGLMQDLLSGEVRTTDVDVNIPEEVAKYG